MSGAVPPLPLAVCMAWTGTILPHYISPAEFRLECITYIHVYIVFLVQNNADC
jgi:hypothetical protein